MVARVKQLAAWTCFFQCVSGLIAVWELLEWKIPEGFNYEWFQADCFADKIEHATCVAVNRWLTGQCADLGIGALHCTIFLDGVHHLPVRNQAMAACVALLVLMFCCVGAATCGYMGAEERRRTLLMVYMVGTGVFGMWYMAFVIPLRLWNLWLVFLVLGAPPVAGVYWGWHLYNKQRGAAPPLPSEGQVRAAPSLRRRLQHESLQQEEDDAVPE